jgi:hypothetical protein
MNEIDWQAVREGFSRATVVMRSFSEAIIEPVEPTWKDKLATILYNTVYFIAYHPLRWAYLIWDATEDAFNDAWERWDV